MFDIGVAWQDFDHTQAVTANILFDQSWWALGRLGNWRFHWPQIG